MSPAILFVTICVPALLACAAVVRHRRDRHRPAPSPDFDAIACASTKDGIVVQTLDGIIIWANPAYLALVGLPRDRVIGRNPLSFCLPLADRKTPEEIAAFRYDPADPQWRTLCVVRNRRSDGTLFWNQLNVSFHHGCADGPLAVLVCRDVSDQVDATDTLRETTRALARLAERDGLTGVANRNRFNTVIAEALAGDPARRDGLGVLQIDLDRFKTINDHHGHAAGDAALRHVAAIMARNLRQTDLLARLGGDEFVAVCTGITQESEMLRIGRTLCDAVRTPFHHDGQEIAVSVSIGAAIADHRDTDCDSLLRKSDFALYEVKRTGRGAVAIYDSGLHAEVQRRTRLNTQLRDAIEAGRLSFYFQPTIDLATGEVRWFEALARWQHPTHGLMHPSVFLPMAREMNLLAPIDLAAMEAAATLHKRLDYNGFTGIRVGINGSPSLLTDRDHVDQVLRRIARVGVLPRDVVVELAEREVFSDPDRVADHLVAVGRLVDHGFNVLIDGFGAGYAGLLHVDRLAVAGFKVEKALVRHMETAPACERITAMLLQFGREKGITCVASGIETAAQAEMVRRLGGTLGQGNHFARAMPAEDVIDWLRRRRAPPRLASADERPIAPRAAHR